MSAVRATPRLRPADASMIPTSGSRRPTALVAAIGGAWLIVVVAQATGNAAGLHHHVLIEDGPSLWLAIPVFLVGWQVMVVAMMLPASLPAIRMFATMSRSMAHARLAVAAFLGAYAITWTTFGLLAFLGDLVLHRMVDDTPWLAERPWLVQAAVLGLAGAYQFAPLKRRSLAACRHPGEHVAIARSPGQGATRLGLRHGLDCLGSSWTLMLVMFGAGFASLFSMVVLTGLMTYEVRGQHGQRIVAPAGLVLIMEALIALSGSLR